MLYTRHDDNWTLHEFTDAEDEIPLSALDVSVPLSDLYLDVEFDAD
jgi:hypothetical protein